MQDESRWENLEPRELIVEAVRDMTSVMLRHHKILRVFMNRSPVDEAIRGRAREQIQNLATRWEELLRQHAKAITHPEPELAIEIAFRMAFATFQRRVQFGPDFGAYEKVSDEKLLDEVGQAIAAYLLEPKRGT